MDWSILFIPTIIIIIDFICSFKPFSTFILSIYQKWNAYWEIQHQNSLRERADAYNRSRQGDR